MPTDLVWTSTLAEGFELKQFASGLLERCKKNLLNGGYNQPAVYVIRQPRYAAAGCRSALVQVVVLLYRHARRLSEEGP